MIRERSQSLAGTRLLFVLATLDLGGAERQALLLAQTLRDACGCEVAVSGLFGGAGKQAVRRICQEKAIPCLRFSMPEFLPGAGAAREVTAESVAHFARELAFLKPDVVLPYTALPNVLCGLTWRQSGLKACIWGQRDAGTGEEDLPQWSQATRKVTHFAANSLAGAEFLETTCGVLRERLALIPNGICLAKAKRSRERWRQEIGAASGDFAAAMIGNIQPLKDHRTLLLAWKQVVTQCPAILCLAGEMTPTAKGLQTLASELGIGKWVRWLGAVDDVTGLLAAMDLAVFSSVKEGLPNGILEPMAAGLAVIATDNTGCRQALGETQKPWLAAAGDAPDLAQKVLAMIAAPELRQHAGTANRERAQHAFSVTAMGRAYEQLIRACLHRPLRIGPDRGAAGDPQPQGPPIPRKSVL